MIDDKEIDIAARAQALSKHINETAYFQLRSIEDFKDGAHWAINEFLNDLWHPAKEIPKYDKEVLIQYKNNRGYNIFFWEEYNFSHQKNSWSFVIDHWLYIDDLFPKKGGKQ